MIGLQILLVDLIVDDCNILNLRKPHLLCQLILQSLVSRSIGSNMGLFACSN